ncbi:methyl-accepting chemotaxis protein [Thiolapillus sp.]
MVVILSVVATTNFKKAGANQQVLSELVHRGAKLRSVEDIVGQKLRDTLFNLNAGALTWADAQNSLKKLQSDLGFLWENYLQALPEAERSAKQNSFQNALDSVQQAIKEGLRLTEVEDYSSLALFVENDVTPALAPFLRLLAKESDALSADAEQLLLKSEQDINQSTQLLYSVIAVGLLLSLLLGWIVYRSINEPLEVVSGTIETISQGDDSARTHLTGSDEINRLGQAFDQMLDEKSQYLQEKEKEAEELNDAVLNLLRGVFTLSQRDLTVKVPVSEDATGPVADAINLMAEETSKVLWNVQQIAQAVEESASTVNGQAITVKDNSEEQTQSIANTMNILNTASEKLQAIATVAKQVNDQANATSHTSEQALSTVSDSLQSMDKVREAIQEAGKRIKRLGERSQEIGSIVDVINSIAERTTVLALNASMQAASAGEAGRGFAVVADEVQRLAANARQSTEQIAGLVKNIQVETSDTISNMDRVISQVVESSEKAQNAGEQMTLNQSQIEQLVKSVESIARASVDQAKIAADLSKRAETINEKIAHTHEAIVNQMDQTEKLTVYATDLVSSVSVFKLPENVES